MVNPSVESIEVVVFRQEEGAMAKGYIVTTYRAIHDTEKLAAYAKLAGPAVQAFGGRFLVRGNPVKTFEAGLNLRTIVVEFDSAANAQPGLPRSGPGPRQGS